MATAPSPAEFREYFGEFGNPTAYPDTDITKATNRAIAISSVSLEALRYLIAHELALGKEASVDPDGGSGEVASESIGPRSVSYASQSERPKDVYFTRTSYGRTFLALESRIPRKVMSVTAY